MKSDATLADLLSTLPQQGTLRWIGLRPARREPLQSVKQAEVTTEIGLVGDRYAGRNGKRQVTLIQYEHLGVIASNLHSHDVDPALLRRNLCISGVNLLAFKGKRWTIGTAVFEYTGLCHPCSRMEETFGDGGYNAVRGHGGITACVIQGGVIALGDTVLAAPSSGNPG